MAKLPAAGWFPQIRAVLVALHLLAVTLLALPSVGEGMFRSAWKDPTVQEEFADWTARLNRWGAHVTQQQFEDDLYDTASAYESARRQGAETVRPLLRLVRHLPIVAHVSPARTAIRRAC